MATNKVATVVLFDVGSNVSSECDSGETFFKRCQWCLLRIISRKIFSNENDELAIVLFGTNETDNNLSIDDEFYQNICEFTPLKIPDWELYEKVQKLEPTDVSNSNWIECLVVGLDYMKEQTKGKRFKDKQVIFLTNFAMELNYDEVKIELIIDSMNTYNIKLIVIGVDLDEECKDKELDSQLTSSLGLVLKFLDKLESGVSLNFFEAESDIIYYEKKGKMGRFTKLNLTIGSKIDIPVRWIKLNLEPTRIKWDIKPKHFGITNRIGISQEPLVKKYVPPEVTIRYVQNEQKVTRFGETEVVLSYADLEAMKRKSGPPCCTLLGVVRSQRISRQMFIGKDMYLIVPEKSPRAQRMFSAFIDALIEVDKYALVRRITTNNGKIKLGVLIPVSDNVGKFFYFIQVPFAEYSLTVPDTALPEPSDTNVARLFDRIIDEMTIPVKPKELPMKDPTFQLRCHILHLFETGQLKKDSLKSPLPDFIKSLCNPFPELKANASKYLKELEKILPIRAETDRIVMNKENQKKFLKEVIENFYSQPGKSTTSDVDGNKEVIKEEVEENKVNVALAEAETQEWPDELKEKYSKVGGIDLAIPSISLVREKLSTPLCNDDEDDNVHLIGKQNVTEEPMIVENAAADKPTRMLTASEQMSLEKQVISTSLQNTEDLLAGIKESLDRK